ncbi:MAG TPA: class I SAM-dependent methyltransferase [Thermoanaerobaculia bacterium]|nr:class I SAM-dependent methyltransferase [Thermoanaerobaculia bacterium]
MRRKVALAVAAAEYFLRRPIGSVFDVGCGEAAWYPHLRVLRRHAKYSGIDASDYVVEEFGESRNISRGSFDDLRKLRGSFDLVVCSDVLHYVADRELRRGLPHLERLTAGIAFIEVLTGEDDIIGDVEGLIRRPAEWYRRQFANAGFAQAGPYVWLPRVMQDSAAELEMLS